MRRTSTMSLAEALEGFTTGQLLEEMRRRVRCAEVGSGAVHGGGGAKRYPASAPALTRGCGPRSALAARLLVLLLARLPAAGLAGGRCVLAAFWAKLTRC